MKNCYKYFFHLSLASMSNQHLLFRLLQLTMRLEGHLRLRPIVRLWRNQRLAERLLRPGSLPRGRLRCRAVLRRLQCSWLRRRLLRGQLLLLETSFQCPKLLRLFGDEQKIIEPINYLINDCLNSFETNTFYNVDQYFQ